MEESLVPGVFLLSSCDSRVLLECLLEVLDRTSNFLRNFGTRTHLLHESSAGVVLAMPLDGLRGLAVEDQPDRSLGLVHHASHVVTVSQLVTESVAVPVK